MKRLFLSLCRYGFLLFGSRGHDEDGMLSEDDILAEQVWAIAHASPKGFTVNIRDMTAPTEGIVVSYAATQNSFGEAGLRRAIAHARTHASYVGGWMEATDSSSLYFFDSEALFSEQDLDAAIAFGRLQGQRAIYIISSNSTVFL